MESKGLNLYKVGKWSGIFYFKKDNPRKIKYILDYQGSTDESYYEIHKSDGWNLNFKTVGSISRWSIWSKEYIDQKPEMYTNDEEILTRAKKILIIHSICFLPILSMGLASTITEIQLLITRGEAYFSFINIILMVEFGNFYINILGYYIRTRKRLLKHK